MTQIVEFSFHPTPEDPTWGCLHVITAAYGGELGGRATMRGDVDLVRAFKETYHDRGPVPAHEDDDGRNAIGGTWQMIPGWPDDWGYDALEDDNVWSDPFEITPDGARPIGEQS